MTPSWIAEEPVVFVYADGRRNAGRIAVGLPEHVGADEARCSIALDGLERTRPIHGATTLQALLLAIRFLGMRLHDFMLKGGRVVDPNEDTDVPLGAFLGTLLRAAEPPTDDAQT